MKTLAASLLLVLLLPAARAGSPDRNPFVEMMRSMLDMYEMMQLYRDLSNGGDHLRPPLPPPPPPKAPRDSSQAETLPPFSPQSTRQLQGAWASNSRILLAVKDHLARFYWARDKYRDFDIEILPPRLRLTDKDTGQVQEFEVSLQGDRLVLRDSQGRLALFKRVLKDPAPAFK